MRVYALLEGLLQKRQEMREHTMLKIGEFARVGQVSIATLRHYDQCGLLKPTTLDPGLISALSYIFRFFLNVSGTPKPKPPEQNHDLESMSRQKVLF